MGVAERQYGAKYLIGLYFAMEANMVICGFEDRYRGKWGEGRVRL